MLETNKQLPKLYFFLTANDIGDTGATSLSDALKSNTALTELYLWSQHKGNNTQMTHANNTILHSNQINREQHWRKRNYINE